MQMLTIVKATFPHPTYEDSSIQVDCAEPSSTAEQLACAWKAIETSLASPSNSERLPEDAIPNMIKVRAIRRQSARP